MALVTLPSIYRPFSLLSYFSHSISRQTSWTSRDLKYVLAYDGDQLNHSCRCSQLAIAIKNQDKGLDPNGTEQAIE